MPFMPQNQRRREGGGDKGGMSPTEIPMLKKIFQGFLVNIIAIVISVWGLRPQIPTRALPLDPLGTSVPVPPFLSPSETNFWLRPCTKWHFMC